MDDLDHTIISALRGNARIPITSLAAITGASRATVSARIDRLVEDGIITAFTIETAADPGQSGIRAIIMIEVHGKAGDRVSDLLRGIPQVRALHSTNGRWDFIAELEDRDLAALDETLRRIRMIDGINSTETNILLKSRMGRRS